MLFTVPESLIMRDAGIELSSKMDNWIKRGMLTATSTLTVKV